MEACVGLLFRSDLRSLDLKSMVCIVAAKAAVLSPSPRCLGKVPEAWCQRWSSMAALRRFCDLPPFRLFSSRLVFQEPTFEASSTSFLGLCLCALWFPKTAFGDDARGLRAVQVHVQRSTCSRLLAYCYWLGGLRISRLLPV
ncbi:hypothetical protein Bca4012_037217 [Brassica carinata]